MCWIDRSSNPKLNVCGFFDEQFKQFRDTVMLVENWFFTAMIHTGKPIENHFERQYPFRYKINALYRCSRRHRAVNIF